MGNPYEDLAQKIDHEVSVNGTHAGFTTMSFEVEKRLSKLSYPDKCKEWDNIAKALEANGVLPKMGAELLYMRAESLDKKDSKDGKTLDGLIHGKALQDYGSDKVVHPMFRTLEKEAAKQFDMAARLHKDDGVLDMHEVRSWRDRQTKLASAEFQTKRACDKIEEGLTRYLTIEETNKKNWLGKRCSDAYDSLKFEIGMRSAMETPSEEAASWQTFKAGLLKKDPEMIGKLATGWLYEQTADNKQVTYADLERAANSRSPMLRDLAEYAKLNFANTTSVDGYERPNQSTSAISRDEVGIYGEHFRYEFDSH